MHKFYSPVSVTVLLQLRTKTREERLNDFTQLLFWNVTSTKTNGYESLYVLETVFTSVFKSWQNTKKKLDNIQLFFQFVPTY